MFAALVHTTGTGFLSYLLSFVYVGIYWNNHHHLLLSVLAYFPLQWTILRLEERGSALRVVMGWGWKGKASAALYALGLASAVADGGDAHPGVWIA